MSKNSEVQECKRLKLRVGGERHLERRLERTEGAKQRKTFIRARM